MFRHHRKFVGSKPVTQSRVFQSGYNHVPNLARMELE